MTSEEGQISKLIQKIHPLQDFNICMVEDISQCLQEESIRSVMRKEVCKPFDLTSQAFRFALYPISPCKVTLCVMLHHIVADGASIYITAKEIIDILSGSQLPRQITAKEDKSVPAESSQDMNIKQKKLDAWITLLGSSECCTTLSSNDPGTPYDQDSERACDYQNLEVPEETAIAIRTISRSSNVSPTLVILTAFATAVHKYTRKKDVVLGVLSLGRDYKTQKAVGCLASTLPLRVDFSPEDLTGGGDLNGLLKQVKTNWSLILDGGIDLTDLVPYIPCLQHKPSSKRISPLLVVFSYYNVSREKIAEKMLIDGTEVQCEVEAQRSGTSHMDLFIEVRPQAKSTRPQAKSTRPQAKSTHPQAKSTFPQAKSTCPQAKSTFPQAKSRYTQYTFNWEYRKSVLTHNMVERLHILMCKCIESAAAHGSMTNVDLALDYTTPDSNISIAIGAVDSSMSTIPDDHLSYIERFEKKCLEIPHSPIFLHNGKDMTYTAAWLYVRQLAVLLTEEGVREGDHVGIYMTRSPWLYIGVLAALKCGAVYVPIALQNPPERVTKILIRAEVKLLLTEEHLLQKLPQYIRATLCVDLTNEPQMLEKADLARLPNVNHHQDRLFYIIFTSGTTGEPKGVAITHGNMQNTLDNFQRLISPDDSIVTLASINISFDGHVLDFLGPLLNGACLVVAEDITHMSDGITYCMTTPSAASIVDFPTSMRAIIIGGEAFTQACYHNTTKITKVFNCYGPSECTVFVTAKHVCILQDVPSIGTPVPNVKAMVMNESLQVVPLNTPGILYIGGNTVSTIGYYGDPILTRKVFIPNPYDPSETLYCTGDVVQMRSDGSLEFYGRKDDQAKLRGMRFQLLEVEKTLASNVEVSTAIALVHNEGTPSAKLVAFVTPESVDIDPLFKHASSCLPSYMVPSTIIPLSMIPLTKEGKVNRRALIEIHIPQFLSSAASQEVVKGEQACVSETVAKLASIFGRVVGIDSYKPGSDFFASGGHSLLTFQLVKLINREMDSNLNLAHVLQYSSPISLAQVVYQMTNYSTYSANMPDDCNLEEHTINKVQTSQEKNCRSGPSSLKESTVQVAGKLGATSHQLSPHEAQPIREGKLGATSHSKSQLPPHETQLIWSDFSYLDPIPNIPLSPKLQESLESLCQATAVDASETASKKLLEETGYKIPISSLVHYPATQVLQSHLKLKAVLIYSSTAKDPLVQLHSPNSPDELPIFFVHGGVIGWPLPYLKLAQSLSRYSIAIQHVMDAPTSSFGEMAAYYTQAVQSVQPHGPYMFVGVCYGAALVYEMAKLLSGAGECIQLAVLVNGSPVNENRPMIFNSTGQPLVNLPAHPVHFFQSTLQLTLPLKEMNKEGVNLEDVISEILASYPWLPFTALQLHSAYVFFLNSVKCLWYDYSPTPGAKIESCILIRSKEQHAFFKSHDYGLLQLVDSSNLSVLIPPTKLGLLSETDTMCYVSSVIKLYLK